MKERLHFVEAMRATLMVLVVVYHVAAIYKPDQNWLIYSHSTSELFGYIAAVAYTFRMPGFFLISGYLAAVSLTSKSPGTFIKLRLERIGIPLVATALSFNSVQSMLLLNTGWKDFSFSEYISNGEYISHLWFLVNLLCYFSLIALITLFVTRNDSLKNVLHNTLIKIFATVPYFIMILILAFGSWCISVSYRFGFPLFKNYGGVIYMPHLMAYLPFFLFGAAAFVTDSITKLASINIFSLIILLIAGWIPLDFLSEYFTYGHIVKDYQPFLLRWVSVFLCLTFFYRYFNKPYKLFKKISESSYSVYLSHHLLVIALGLIFLKINLNIYISFPIILTLVATLSYAFHCFIVNRSKMAKLLFNGITT
jgi:glucan biosynthesis protein C